MKIASLIPSYSPTDDRFGRVAAELSRVSTVYAFSPDASVGTAANWIKCDRSLGERLVFEPRKWIRENLDQFDYFLYNEDDILVRSDQVKTLIDIQNSLPHPFVSGFLRYEWFNGERRYIDMHPAHSVHTGGNGTTDVLLKMNDHWFSPFNVHSGNFLLSSLQVRELIDVSRWDTFFGEHGIQYCGCLESGATSVYRTYKKVLPTQYSVISVEHLSTKYGYMPPTPNDERMADLLK